MDSPANQLIESLGKTDLSLFKSGQDRSIAVRNLRSILASWTTPIEQIFELTWIQPAYISALKITIDTELYTKWVAQGGTPQTANRLSEMSGIDESILVRLLRHIVAMNGLKQPRPGTYSLTPFTSSLAGFANKDAFRLIFEQNYPAFPNLPGFLAKEDWKGPLNPAAGNWQYLHKAPGSYIEYLISMYIILNPFYNILVE